MLELKAVCSVKTVEILALGAAHLDESKLLRFGDCEETPHWPAIYYLPPLSTWFLPLSMADMIPIAEVLAVSSLCKP